jgi:hypothetical protein
LLRGEFLGIGVLHLDSEGHAKGLCPEHEVVVRGILFPAFPLGDEPFGTANQGVDVSLAQASLVAGHDQLLDHRVEELAPLDSVDGASRYAGTG